MAEELANLVEQLDNVAIEDGSDTDANEVDLFENLNEPQLEAVTYEGRNLLVLAGAGSGKTHALTRRIAKFMLQDGVDPDNIVSVTFTNKAANEMKERIQSLTGRYLKNVGTFHSIFGKLLRKYCELVEYNSNFTVLKDSMPLLRAICKEKMTTIEPEFAKKRMEEWKNDGLLPDQVKVYSERDQEAQQVYEEYQERCIDMNVVDYGDMLMLPLQILENNADVLRQVQGLWTHLFVDEYQDTNMVQYRLVAILTTPTTTVTVVGDDNQSIYGWRGAKVDNIQRFHTEFKAHVVKLEQNYRSTSLILDGANRLISNNTTKFPKNLFCTAGQGKDIQLDIYFDAKEEAIAIARKIGSAISAGVRPNEIAVLYRTNAQSREIETALHAAGIRFIIVKGQRFFDRKEVQEFVNHAKLVLNPHNDEACLRVLQTLQHVGEVSIKKLSAVAAEYKQSLWATLLDCDDIIPAKMTQESLRHIRESVPLLRDLLSDKTSTEVLTRLLTASGMEGKYARDERMDNLRQLIAASVTYRETSGEDSLATFITDVDLQQDLDAVGDEDTVLLMTLHTAKGLEFDTVFMIGVVDGILPHWIAVNEGNLEEERRLCYVGLTRAKRALHLSVYKSINLGNYTKKAKPSDFLKEISDEFAIKLAHAWMPVKTAAKAPKPFGLEAVAAYGSAYKARPMFRRKK